MGLAQKTHADNLIIISALLPQKSDPAGSAVVVQCRNPKRW